MVFLVALVGIILFTDFSKRQKLLMSVLLFVFHVIGLSAVVHSDIVATLLVLLGHSEFDVVGVILIFLLLYIIPFLLRVLLVKSFKKKGSVKV